MLCEIAKRITYAYLSSNYPNVIVRLNVVNNTQGVLCAVIWVKTAENDCYKGCYPLKNSRHNFSLNYGADEVWPK